VKQQGLLVVHEKLIELQIHLRNKGGDAIHIGGDFRDLGHRFILASVLLSCRTTAYQAILP
jgi:hypothetical protein